MQRILRHAHGSAATRQNSWSQPASMQQGLVLLGQHQPRVSFIVRSVMACRLNCCRQPSTDSWPAPSCAAAGATSACTQFADQRAMQGWLPATCSAQKAQGCCCQAAPQQHCSHLLARQPGASSKARRARPHRKKRQEVKLHTWQTLASRASTCTILPASASWLCCAAVTACCSRLLSSVVVSAAAAVTASTSTPAGGPASGARSASASANSCCTVELSVRSKALPAGRGSRERVSAGSGEVCPGQKQ